MGGGGGARRAVELALAIMGGGAVGAGGGGMSGGAAKEAGPLAAVEGLLPARPSSGRPGLLGGFLSGVAAGGQQRAPGSSPASTEHQGLLSGGPASSSTVAPAAGKARKRD